MSMSQSVSDVKSHQVKSGQLSQSVNRSGKQAGSQSTNQPSAYQKVNQRPNAIRAPSTSSIYPFTSSTEAVLPSFSHVFEHGTNRFTDRFIYEQVHHATQSIDISSNRTDDLYRSSYPLSLIIEDTLSIIPGQGSNRRANQHRWCQLSTTQPIVKNRTEQTAKQIREQRIKQNKKKDLHGHCNSNRIIIQ